MVIKSAAGRAFAAVCLTAIATFPGAHAQMSPAPGAYGPAPRAYGPYGPAPGAYGPLWPRTRRLRPLWPRTRRLRPTAGNLCPAEPAIGWDRTDNQRTAGQPG
jgi:hypothetical protein